MSRRLFSWTKTSEYYRGLGYRVAKTEYTTRGKSHDLLGFIDGIAMGPGDLIALQACGKDWQPHVRKILGPCREDAISWLLTGNRIILIGWRKLRVPIGRDGRKQDRWKPRIREFTLEDF